MADTPFLPLQGEGLDLKSGRFRSKKTGRYTRRVDLESIVSSIKSIFTSVASVDKSTAALAQKGSLIRDDIKKFVELSVGSRANRPQSKPKTAIRTAASNVASTVKTAGFNALGLAGLILLLKNEKIMAIVKGFFTGFLKSLGVSEETINLLGTVAKTLAKAFELYLGYKLFKSVYDAFMAMKNLGMAMGLLSEKNAAAGARLSAKEAQLEAKESAAALKDNKKLNSLSRRLKKAKLNVRKVSAFFTNSQRRNKVIKTFFTNRIKTIREGATKVATKFKTFIKLVFNTLKGIRKAVSIAKIGMAAVTFGISYIIGAVVDAAIGTAIDYFTAKQLDDKPPGIAEVVGLFGKNFVESITLGLVSGDKIKDIATNMARKIFSWFDKAISFFGGKKEEKKPAVAEQKATADSQLTPRQIESMVAGFKPGLSKQQFDKEWKVNARISILGPKFTDNTKIRDKIWTEYSKKQIVSEKPNPATTNNQTTSSSATPAAAKPQAKPSPTPSSSASNAQNASFPASSPSTGGAASTPAPAASASAELDTAPKEMSVASLAENVALDKKEDQQARSSAGVVVTNNINTTNVIGSSGTPIAKKQSSTIFSDTVGY